MSFRLYAEQNGVLRLLTTANYEIFLFSSNAPAIVDEPKDNDEDPKFRLGTGSGGTHYFTTESQAQIISKTTSVKDIKLKKRVSYQ